MSVDHMVPKSRDVDKVYEWSNYRLACVLMNARKNKFDDVIDPFDVTEGLFALDLVMMRAIPGPAAGSRLTEVKDTIKRLGLEEIRYAAELGHYYDYYRRGDITFGYLELHAPFLAKELRRQGKLFQHSGPCSTTERR